MAQPTVSRWRRAAVAVKIESTYGSDPTLASGDVVQCRNVVFRVSQAQQRDDRYSGLIWPLPDIPGARSATLSFEMLLRGAAVAYSASVKPEADAVLRACGMAAAGSFGAGTEKWDYTPQSAATMGESVTAALYAENAPHGKLLGCFGSFRLSLRAGEPAVLAVVLSGMYVEPADVSLITGTPAAIVPPVFKSAAVTYDSVTHAVSVVDFDLGNEIQLIPSANDAQAVAGFLIADRRPVASMDPHAVTVATYNFHNKRDIANQAALSLTVGGTQYNRVLPSAPKAQIVDVGETQRNGLKAYQLGLKLNPSVGGDEIKLSFT